MQGFQLATLTGRSLPPITERAAKSGSTWIMGALLKITAGEYEECGADPTRVDAVSLSGVGPDTSGFNRLGVKGFPPGFCQGVETMEGKRFSAEFVGDIDAAVEGVNYGVVRGGDKVWRVDFTETVATVVRLESKAWRNMLTYEFTDESVEEDVVKGANRVIVTFLPSVSDPES